MYLEYVAFEGYTYLSGVTIQAPIHAPNSYGFVDFIKRSEDLYPTYAKKSMHKNFELETF
jgi:hypothetical protein